MMVSALRQDWVSLANEAPRLSGEIAALLAEVLANFQHQGRQPLQALRLALDGLTQTPGSFASMAADCVAEMANQHDGFLLAIRVLRRAVVHATQPVALSTLVAGATPTVWADVQLLTLLGQSFGLAPTRWMAERGGARLFLTGPVPPTAPPLAAVSIGALKGAGLRPKLTRQDQPNALTLALWLPCEA